MKETFEINFAYGATVMLEHEKGSHQIKAISKDQDGHAIDEIALNHNAKLRIMKWLMNTIED